MGDASGTHASPTGSALQNGGAGQQQGNDEGYENESFQLEPGEQNSGQESMRRVSIGTMATQLGGAGTPTTAQQESQAPTARSGRESGPAALAAAPDPPPPTLACMFPHSGTLPTLHLSSSGHLLGAWS